MAARKKTTRKKAKKTARKPKRGDDLLKNIDKELKELSRVLDKRLAPLRKEIDKAERKAGTEGARLLREARKRLNRVDIQGQSDLKKFLQTRRRDLSKALTGLEGAVRPTRKTTAKKSRKKTTRRS